MEEVAQRSRLQPRRVEITRLHIAALDDHAHAIAHARVTRRAVDVVALLPALQHLERSRKRHPIAFFAVDQTGIKIAVLTQLIARHRILHLRTHRAAIRIKSRAALRKELRLVLHVLAAAGQNQRRRHRTHRRELIEFQHSAFYSLFPTPYSLPQWSTSTTETAGNCS